MRDVEARKQGHLLSLAQRRCDARHPGFVDSVPSRHSGVQGLAALGCHALALRPKPTEHRADLFALEPLRILGHTLVGRVEAFEEGHLLRLAQCRRDGCHLGLVYGRPARHGGVQGCAALGRHVVTLGPERVEHHADIPVLEPLTPLRHALMHSVVSPKQRHLAPKQLVWRQALYPNVVRQSPVCTPMAALTLPSVPAS